MADWSKSMQQTFEFYTVDPIAWTDIRKIDQITGGSITHDLETDTISSASLDTTEDLDECYVGIYLITVQNRIRDRFPLGVYLYQTPDYSFDGHTKSISVEAYSPLTELKEKMPPIGYALLKGAKIVDLATTLAADATRTPVVGATGTKTLTSHFVAETEDTWLSYISALLANADYRLGLDDRSRILFEPIQDFASLTPVYTYTDDNSSILYPSITNSRDLYGIPNVVEVVCSNGNKAMYAKAVNDDPNSPISTTRRGREIVHRIVDPELAGEPSQTYLDNYARQTLKSMSSIEYKLTYTHGYCPVRIGDCVRLNYSRAGLENIKAKVIRQNIKLEPGCPVEETAVYTESLWG